MLGLQIAKGAGCRIQNSPQVMIQSMLHSAGCSCSGSCLGAPAAAPMLRSKLKNPKRIACGIFPQSLESSLVPMAVEQQQEQRSSRAMEIVFYDVETSIPESRGQGYEILEFGAVVVSMKGFEELDSFTTLVRPSSLSCVSPKSTACNGIVRQSLLTAPPFQQIADRVHSLLHGRVWAGHNILRFDNLRIKEAFANIGRPGPEAAGFIDTLPLLRKSFGQRAGNLKMDTLASYFGLGRQEHRSLADVRMNLEVLKLCATVVLLESNFPEIFPVEKTTLDSSEKRPRNSRRSSFGTDAFNFNLLAASLEEAAKQDETITVVVEENIKPEAVNEVLQEGNVNSDGVSGNKEELKLETQRFLQTREVPVDSIEAMFEGQWIRLFYGSSPLCVEESMARVKFSVSDRFAFTETGKPTFAIVIMPSPELLAIVRRCEDLVKAKCISMGIKMVWQPVLVTNGGGEAVRIKIGTLGEGSSATYTTKLYRNKQEIQLGTVDNKSFQECVPAGALVDTALRFDAYVYQGDKVGLRLLAEKLILN